MNDDVLKVYKMQKEKLKIENPFLDPKKRILALKMLENAIILNKNAIFSALIADLNKSETEAYMSEIGLVLQEITYMIRHLKKFSRPRRVKTPLAQFASKSFRLPCPYGQVLIISPWNYPVLLTLGPLVDAIAAGNVAVVKPSEISPNVSNALKLVLEQAFSPEEVSVVLGGVEECSLLLEQDFDYIFFTGSTRVGKIVMQKAAENFTPVTLELGGKSPCIVDETANLKLAAKRIVFGKFLNAGQTCVAPDYILCQSKIKDELIREIENQVVLQYGVDPISNPDYPKMINEKQFDAMTKFITEKNAIFGGKYDKNLLKIEPTLLLSDSDAPEMQDEIFGPILPILTFDNFDEAVEFVNNRNHPLALYIFSSNKRRIDHILKHLDFGGGCVNDTIIHLASSNLGFGGLKQSGIGAYHGKVGFETFTHYKSIVDKKQWIDLPMRYQPYSKLKYKIIKMFLK